MSNDVPPAEEGPVVRTGGDRPIRFRVLPLRLVVAGRFGLERGRLHRLDSDGAGGLLERTAPTLALRVADSLRDDGTDFGVQLQFRHRRDFAPGAVARAVPDIARVVATHSAARSGSLAAGLADFPAPRAALDAAGSPSRSETPATQPGTAGTTPPPAVSAHDDDSVDRLLDMVDAPEAGRTAARDDPASAAVSSFIAQVARGTSRPQRAGTPPEVLEAALAKQIGAILSHPDFIAMERAWASLRFLARRIDLRSALKVDVVEADADTLADVLEALVPEDDLDSAGPVRLVVDLSDYDASDRDIGRLRRLAEFGMSRRAIVLSNAAPRFFGEDGPDALASMHDPETFFEAPAYAGWRNLREAAETAWLGLCVTRVALREAPDGRDDRELRFAKPRRIGRLLDVGAAPAVAALVAEANASTDWACALGAGHDPAVENLVLAHDPETAFDGPVRPAPTVGAAESLASAGFVALVPERGRDTARLLKFPAVRRYASREARADGSLTSRLFQAQVVHGLQWNADRIFSTDDAGALRDRVGDYLNALLSGTGPGAGVEVRIATDDDGETVLAVHVRSGSRAAPGASIAFDIPLASAAASPDREL